jgi:hypothetical protein
MEEQFNINHFVWFSLYVSCFLGESYARNRGACVTPQKGDTLTKANPSQVFWVILSAG